MFTAAIRPDARGIHLHLGLFRFGQLRPQHLDLAMVTSCGEQGTLMVAKGGVLNG